MSEYVVLVKEHSGLSLGDRTLAFEDGLSPEEAVLKVAVTMSWERLANYPYFHVFSLDGDGCEAHVKLASDGLDVSLAEV